MKIITKAIINMETLNVIKEDSYQYDGSVAECKGGGGGGSGAVSYPAYLETIHSDWLNQTGADTITSSVTDVMNSALGSSPWTGQVAYDPDTDITAYEAALAGFAVILAGISDTVDWAALYTQAETSVAVSGTTETEIVADVDAFADQLDDEITTKVLPRFRSGMRDINAVVSSAFVVGESVIEGFRNREVAKHNSGIRITMAAENQRLRLEASNQMLNLMLNRIKWEESYAKAVIEGRRIKIVAKKEENDANIKIDEQDALWDLAVFQYGSNVMAGIGGGTGVTGGKGPSTTQSAIGGAMAGAVGGALVGTALGGPVVGTIAGAVLGAATAFV